MPGKGFCNLRSDKEGTTVRIRGVQVQLEGPGSASSEADCWAEVRPEPRGQNVREDAMGVLWRWRGGSLYEACAWFWKLNVVLSVAYVFLSVPFLEFLQHREVFGALVVKKQ